VTNKFNLLLTGDSIIARKLVAYHEEPVNQLLSLIQDSDISFTNLEILPNNFKGYPAARSDGSHFATYSNMLDELKDIGFNSLSLANNHALDYSIEGLKETMKELEKRNMAYSGVGNSLTESRMPVYMDLKNSSMAMLSCTSTFFEEQSAGEKRSETPGRAGINPLRFETVYEVKNEELDFIKNLSRNLGIESQRQEFIKLGFAEEPEDSSLFPLIDTNLRATAPLNAFFKESDRTQVRTYPNKKDLKDICRWVREAKARAQTVVMSLHAHEQGESREHPAEFIELFARRVIDEGADVVVCHGPHLLRGMEVYKGAPIFYSLGNFIGQNELIYKLPEDSYRRFGVNPSLTPSKVYSTRSQNGKKGFPGDDIYWNTVVPICKFESGKVKKIDIVPVGLTHGDKPYKRGTPYYAKGEEAKHIIYKFKKLSNEFGTDINYKNGIGEVLLEN